MSENDNLPASVEPDDDDGPPSALAALRPHLRQYLELRENGGLSQEQCVERIFPGRYANAKDAGWRWEQRGDYKAAVAELHAEAIKRAGLSAAEVLEGIVEVRNRCLQRVRPRLNRKGEHETTDTPDGGSALAYEFDANGAMRASELLANYHGLTKTRTELTGKDGGPIQTQSRAPLESQITPEQADRDYLEIIKRIKTG